MSSSSMSKAPLVDYHVHPDYSIDAEGSVHSYCRVALERGLDEICFTTHYDSEPDHRAEDGWAVLRGRRVSVTGDWLAHYAGEIREAGSEYAGQGLSVKVGMEVGYWQGAAAEVERIVAACRPDYLLGSIHWIEDYAVSRRDSTRAWLERHGPAKAISSYYRALTAAAGSGLFDCIGHVDIYRRSTGMLEETYLDLPPVREAVDEFLAALAATGTGIEINTRDAIIDARLISPGPRLLGLASAARVSAFVAGSDAHSPRVLGAGLGQGLSAARKAGLGHLSTFADRKRTLHPL